MNRHRHAHRLRRRNFLRALGLGAAASPLIPLLNATGQELTRPKRLVLIFEPDGAPALNYNTTVDFRPQGSTTDFTLHPIHAPLEPFKAKLVIPWGLKLTAGGAGEAHAYGMAGLWTGSTLHGPGAGADFDGGNGNRTGWGSGPSIDQVVANSFGPESPYQRAKDDPTPETPYRTVELGVRCLNATSLNRMIYAGDKSPLHPEMNPRAAFDRLFAGVSTEPPPPEMGEDPLKLRKQAIIDVVKGDLSSLRNRIGSEEYAKVDAHLEGLLALERRLNVPTTPPPASCVVPDEPASNASFPDEIRQMFDIAAAALACDVTRVISVQLSYAFSHVTHTWLGHTSDHHTMSHDGSDRRQQLQEIDSWYAQQLAYFLGKLDEVNEGDGTLLDHTLVVCGRELGSTAHRMDRWPVVMAGGSKLGLQTGRYLDFDGQEHAKLLVSMGRLMGLDMNSFGNRAPNSGGLTGIA